MKKIGIFFGTDTGTTRLIAKKMAKILGNELTSKPLNVNRVKPEEMLEYDVLILGTSTYGEGQVPGISTGVKNGSWEEFLPALADTDMSGKLVALYGLGNQEKYPQRFADALFQLYSIVKQCGAEIIGEWSTDGYEFEHSKAVVNGSFVGLVIDNNSQGMLTDLRLDSWLKLIKPALLSHLSAEQAQAS